MEEKTVQEISPVSTSSSSNKTLVIAVLVVFLVLAGVGGYLLYRLEGENIASTIDEAFTTLCEGEKSNGHFLSDGNGEIVPPRLYELNREEVFQEVAEGGARYKKGPDMYYNSTGSQDIEFLSVQGKVSAIDKKTKSVCVNEGGITRKLDFSVKNIETSIVSYQPPPEYSGSGPYVPILVTTSASWEDIEEGDVVTYNIPNAHSSIERILIDKKDYENN